MYFRFFCQICGFEIWAYKVIPKVKCHCGCFADCEEIEITMKVKEESK